MRAEQTPRRDLGSQLEALYRQYDVASFRSTDPVEFLYAYRRPEDLDVVAWIAGTLAYGNVTSVRASVGRVLNALGQSPAQALSSSETRKALRGWKHRFNTSRDLFAFFEILRRSQDEWGGPTRFLNSHAGQGRSLLEAYSALAQVWRKWSESLPKGRGFEYFITDPGEGGACKRWWMIGRWMYRRDQIDPGFALSEGGYTAKDLLLPLDTHTSRLVRFMGFTDRRTVDAKMAIEVTQRLAEFTPEDPVRYDFALSRLGILDRCKGKYDAVLCPQCQIQPYCKLGRK